MNMNFDTKTMTREQSEWFYRDPSVEIVADDPAEEYMYNINICTPQDFKTLSESQCDESFYADWTDEVPF